MSTANPAFDLYQLSEDHRDLRDAVRAIATDKIAPHAAEVDDKAEFPQAAYDALRASEFHAPHIPEQYGGAGADALATCIVIEEVARVCASSSLIPAVNKLGTMPLILGASEDVKARYLPPVARGEAMFSYGLSEREAGSDTAAMRCRATRRRRRLGAQRAEVVDHQRRVSRSTTRCSRSPTPTARRGAGISAFVVEKSDEGFTFGEPEKKIGIKGSPTRELHLRQLSGIPATAWSGSRARA